MATLMNTETHFWICNKTEDLTTINELQVKQLCFGEEHCLLLTNDGRVFTFGTNSSGQLGTGATNGHFTETLHVDVYENEGGELLPLPKISRIACGPYNCAAVGEEGIIFMWGDNSSGQCLDSVNDKLLRPRLVAVQQQITVCQICSKESNPFVKFTQVSCGKYHTIGLSIKGELWSWGSMGSPQLGTQSVVRCDRLRQPPTKIEFLAGFQVLDIACGYDHSLALVEAGQMNDSYYCDNCFKLKLGNRKKFFNALNKDCENTVCPLGLPLPDLKRNSRSTSSSNLSNFSPSGHNELNGVIGEEIDSFSMEDNFQLNCNGDNKSYFSQLFTKVSNVVKQYNRELDSTNSEQCEFEVLPLEPECSKILNESYLCDSESYENSFWAFRRTDSFKNLVELKNRYRTEKRKSDSDEAFSQQLLTENNWTPKLENNSCSKNYRCDVWSWGRGDSGQLGHGDLLDRSHPCKINELSARSVQRVFASNRFSLALTSSGNVFAWGNNQFGQLGFKGFDNILVPRQLVFESSSTCWDIAVGSHHCLILADLHFPSVAIYSCGKHQKEDLLRDKRCSSCIDTSPAKNSGLVGPIKQLMMFDRSVIIRNVYAGGPFSSCVTFSSESKYSLPNRHVFAAFERHFHLSLRLIMRKVFHCLLNDNQFLKESSKNVLHPLTSLVALWSRLKDLVSLNAYDSRLLLQERCEIVSLNMVENYLEWIDVYKELIDSIANVIAVNGISACMKFMCLSPNTVKAIAAEIYGQKSTKKKSASELLYILLSIPTKRVHEYITFMERFSVKNVTEKKRFVVPPSVLNSWKLIKNYGNNELKKAQLTRAYWESSPKKLQELYCVPSRRLVKESRSEPLTLISTTLPTSSSILTSPLFTLFNDVFVYYFGQFVTIPVETIWIDTNDDSLSECHFRLIFPEDKITFSAQSPESRTSWIAAFNQSIKTALERQKYCDTNLLLKKSNGCQESSSFSFPPVSRNAFYQFKKDPIYKDATYLGSWLDAKLHGTGDLLWSDGRSFTGNFKDSVQNGEGIYKIEDSDGTTVYKGTWVKGKMKGLGSIKYPNGDTYNGYFDNDERNGFGVLKRGPFLNGAVNMYVGEWKNDKRNGYGVRDDLESGEKYLGFWKDDARHGNGIVVTVDGIYYEGTFVNEVLTGPGLLVFDDGTVYDGELGPGGFLKGKGTMKLPNGDVMEGIFNGVWSEDVKINGVFRKNSNSNGKGRNFDDETKEVRIGKHSISAEQKWNCVFDECKQLLRLDSGSNKIAWDSIAISVHKKRIEVSRKSLPKYSNDLSKLNSLEKIPKYAQKSNTKLTSDDYFNIKEYLMIACDCTFHPLGMLVSTLVDVYGTSYAKMCENMWLLPHAIDEIKSFVRRIYEIVKFLFPDLPDVNTPLTIPLNEERTRQSLTVCDIISNENGQVCLTVTPSCLLHPILFPSLYPSLSTLYGLKCEKDDSQYWDRLMRWNKQSDMSLLAFLGVDEKFYLIRDDGDDSTPIRVSTRRVSVLLDASKKLQHISTAFTPVEKLRVVKETIDTAKSDLPDNFMWGMDHLFPVFLFVVVRAKIKKLGAEIHFVEDLMDESFANGELGFMLATLKASYRHIIIEKLCN